METGLVVQAVKEVASSVNVLMSNQKARNIVKRGELDLLRTKIKHALHKAHYDSSFELLSENLANMKKIVDQIEGYNFSPEMRKVAFRQLYTLNNRLEKNLEEFSSDIF